MKKMVAFFAVFLIAGVLSAQESSDELFANPEPDGPADTSQKVPLEAFSGQSMRFFESLKVDGYYVTGKNAKDEVVNSPVNALNFGFGTDVRLDKTARAYASLYLAYPNPRKPAETTLYNPYEPPVDIAVSEELTFTQIQVKELFLDYSLGTFAIARVGRQTATWGQGRLFNPGNLVAGIGDGMAAKVSAAVGPLTVTTAFIKNDGLYQVSGDTASIISFASVGTALLTEYSSPWFSTGLSGFYHYNLGEKGSAYVKSSFWGTDFFVEGLGEWGLMGEQSWTGVTGVYREIGGRVKWLKLQAEWLVSGRGNDGSFSVVTNRNLGWNDQTVGLAATSELLGFIGMKPSVMWLHSLADSSGQLVVGLVNSSLAHIDLTAAVSQTYGGAASRYVVNNPDPQKRMLSLTLKASFQFEVKN